MIQEEGSSFVKTQQGAVCQRPQGLVIYKRRCWFLQAYGCLINQVPESR